MKSFTKAHLDQWLLTAKQITNVMTSKVAIQQIRQEYNLSAGQGIWLYISMCHESEVQFPLWNNMLLWVFA